MKDHEIIELYWARNESAITATTRKVRELLPYDCI